MAFATSNVRKGTVGDLKLTAGQWTGSVGDARGSFLVEGGLVLDAVFNTNTSTGPTNGRAAVTWTAPTGTTTTTTINVDYHEAVTKGTFVIVHA